MHTFGELFLQADLDELTETVADACAQDPTGRAECHRAGDARAGFERGDKTFDRSRLGMGLVAGSRVDSGGDEAACGEVVLHESGHPALFAERIVKFFAHRLEALDV